MLKFLAQRKSNFFVKGFTMVELLLTVALVSVIAGVALPSLGTYYVNNLLKETADEMVDRLKTAQTRSIYGDNGETHGVFFDSNYFVLYLGNEFDVSNPENVDSVIGGRLEIFDIDLENNQVVFNKYSGLPDNAGSLKLKIKGSNRYWLITINEQGMIDENFF